MPDDGALPKDDDMGGDATEQLRVGSWPGRRFRDNDFIPGFIAALEGAGASVADVDSPEEVDPRSLDVLQIHWPEQVYWRGGRELRGEWAALKALAAIRRLRRSGVRIVWMVHNLAPHDAGRRRRTVWRLYAGLLARLTDGYVALSPGTRPLIAHAFPFARGTVGLSVRHPAYAPAATVLTKGEARARWGVADSPLVLAFIGSLRPYKGVEALVSAVRDMGGRSSAVIGGEVRGGGLDEVLPRLAAGAAVDLRLRRLSDDEFAGVVQAADYVVLPFQSILHSGSVIHALSLGRPVLTLRTPYTEDLQEVIGADWVQVFDGTLTAERLAVLPPSPTGRPDLSLLSPQIFGRQMVDFYHALAAGPAAR